MNLNWLEAGEDRNPYRGGKACIRVSFGKTGTLIEEEALA
jgi:hypothetical protein